MLSAPVPLKQLFQSKFQRIRTVQNVSPNWFNVKALVSDWPPVVQLPPPGQHGRSGPVLMVPLPNRVFTVVTVCQVCVMVQVSTRLACM